MNPKDQKYGKVLVVDDDMDILHAAKLLLKRHVEQVDTEPDPTQLPALLKNESYDVILMDMNFSKDTSSGEEGMAWLN
ncbi:MAG: response regulator, partial [Candidatus Marinimicrobia bacterium]|nr:response regulator [Candidatus Neomarinimicrobiota bacterium]